LAEIVYQESLRNSGRVVDRNTLNTLLSRNGKEFCHGGEFTGRPLTSIHTDGRIVLKLRYDIKHAVDNSRRWIQHAVQRERELHVHHPEKIWLLILHGDVPVIGSLTPHLQPLHTVLESPDVDENA
jgi:hypothetical protein